MLGRPWPQPGEQLWTDEDAEYAMAWVEDLSAHCPGGCGQYQADSLDPASEGHWDVDVVRCHACKARAAAADGFDNRAGLMFAVSRDN